jgi:threonine synthase
MGLPIDKLICASNENNILTDFLNTGNFDLRDRKLKKTISPAIDILIPSNIERLLYIITKDADKVRNWQDELKANKYFRINDETLKTIKEHFIADYCSESSCYETIKKTFDEYKIIIDPHTSVAKCIADKYTTKITLIASTAHYGKFPEAVCHSLNLPTNIKPIDIFKNFESLNAINSFHSKLYDVLNAEVIHKDSIEGNLDEIKKLIFNKLSL